MTEHSGHALPTGALPWNKFHPPLCEFEAIIPPAAAGLARAATLPRLALLCAPPGYGKTVLMTGLYERHLQRGTRCAWITLDDRDRELHQLVRLIDQAIDQALGPGACGDAPPALQHADGLTALHQRLLGLQEPLALFIDNLHHCTDERLGELLGPLVFDGTRLLRCVFSSVHDLPLDLARAKMELNAVHLQVEHLMFDGQCSAQLFEQASLETSAELIARSQERTEGWPAALRLLAVLSQQQGSLRGALAQFSGEDVDIADVLAQRVLTGFEPEVVTFLREIALLREFSAPLARQATGCEQAAQWIELLRSRNVLLFPLDRNRRWWRLHTLLRQYLLGTGEASITTARRQDVLQHAARWHADHGDMTHAIDLAIEAGAMPMARAWLDTIAQRVVADQGLLVQFVRWVEVLSAAGFAPSHEAQAWHIWSLCFTRQSERALRALDALSQQGQTGETCPVDIAMQQRLRLQRAVALAHTDAMAQCVIDADDWLAQDNGRDAYGTCIAHGAVGVVELARGAPVVAWRRILLAEGAISRTESPYGRTLVETVASCILIARGEPLDAERRLTAARLAFSQALETDSDLIHTLDLVHSRALLDLGRTEEARAAALRGLVSAGRYGVTDCVAPGLSVCVALGQADDAEQASRLDAVARNYPPRLQCLLDAFRVRRLLRLELRDAARELARTTGLLDASQSPAEPAPPWDDGQFHMARIELMATSGRSAHMQDEIAVQVRQARAAGRLRDLLEWHLLSASLHVRAGEQPRAVRQLALAIALAATRRLLWPFIEHANAIGAILQRARNKDFGFTQPDELQLLERLRHCGQDAPPANADAPAVEHLTTRELQLIELLGLGLDNQQIADRAGLSVPTVKWHLYNCYAKLGVKTRIAAVTRARAIGAIV
ncbi:LuxR C-terminal-related transcriptional regulator [Variovorax ginsengisoli]|uniref:LuxR family maltose regulon positive regulatory protein n=1 Tax=Variovorax ginsengisoli TaxID=363844 RepID=A0ABT9S9I0_9BURK|nr:LuxR C-terminal-related transcriptional regulator [Variovorax ginsengisoli]MDP9901015.1 LuxR family maltose regulon positive regulatory protein [Variovorax ginsengisoli]